MSRWLGPGFGWVVLCLCELCGWEVQVSVYCARRIPMHVRCT